MNRAAPEPKDNMGQPEPRIEARLKVTGEARYASDFPVSNPAFAFLVTSSIAKGSIQSIDLREAKSVPGVLEIFTHENTGELKKVKFGGGGGGASTSIQDLGPKILHDGQIVGDGGGRHLRGGARGGLQGPRRLPGRKAKRDVRIAGRHRRGCQQGRRDCQGPAAGRRRARPRSPPPRSSSKANTPRRPEHHNPIELFTTTAVVARRRTDDL